MVTQHNSPSLLPIEKLVFRNRKSSVFLPPVNNIKTSYYGIYRKKISKYLRTGDE